MTTENQNGRATRSTREKGADDDSLILTLICELGYASSKQVAKAVYGKLTASTLRMANRKLASLIRRKFLLEKRESISSVRLVALSKFGAGKLAEIVPVYNRSGKDFLRHAHSHRTRCHDVFSAVVWHEVDPNGAVYWSALSEFWIQHNPESARQFGARSSYTHEGIESEKVADLLLNPVDESDRVWVEVENGARSSVDLGKVANWLTQVAYRGNQEFKEVWFVVTRPGANTIKARLREALLQENLQRRGWVDGRPIQIKKAALAAWEKCRFFKLDQLALELVPM